LPALPQYNRGCDIKITKPLTVSARKLNVITKCAPLTQRLCPVGSISGLTIAHYQLINRVHFDLHDKDIIFFTMNTS